jgi:hypothetical protein
LKGFNRQFHFFGEVSISIEIVLIEIYTSEIYTMSAPHPKKKIIKDGLLKCTQSALKCLVLPTLSKQFACHNRLLKPTSKGEESLQIASYILRKWRFSVSDSLAFYWHSYGHSTQGQSKIYKLGTRLLTRRSADEYFFKSIPQRTTSIEFIYPSSCDLTSIQQQLHHWLKGMSNRVHQHCSSDDDSLDF